MCPDILVVNFFLWLPLSAKVVSIYRLTGSRELNVKALAGAFNQEKDVSWKASDCEFFAKIRCELYCAPSQPQHHPAPSNINWGKLQVLFIINTHKHGILLQPDFAWSRSQP